MDYQPYGNYDKLRCINLDLSKNKNRIYMIDFHYWSDLLIIDNDEKVCPTVEYMDSRLRYDFALWITEIKYEI